MATVGHSRFCGPWSGASIRPNVGAARSTGARGTTIRPIDASRATTVETGSGGPNRMALGTLRRPKRPRTICRPANPTTDQPNRPKQPRHCPTSRPNRPPLRRCARPAGLAVGQRAAGNAYPPGKLTALPTAGSPPHDRWGGPPRRCLAPCAIRVPRALAPETTRRIARRTCGVLRKKTSCASR